MEARSDRRAWALARGVVAVAVVVGLMPPAAPALAQGVPCEPVLADETQGEAAVDQLGADLAEVADDHDLAPTQLTEELREDDSLWVDRCGQLYYAEPLHRDAAVEPTAGEPTTEASGEPAVEQNTVPLSETFTLHSRPGAQRVIYLDFDGHSLTGTAWNAAYGLANGYALAAYDYDASAGFSDWELKTFQLVWKRVAEDFAPFDVDVTTEDPGIDAITRDSAADTMYGTRAVITNETSLQSRCNCGGHAYAGVFNRYDAPGHAYYQPAIVYSNGAGFGDKNLAEAISHEVGHNLGLRHDGTSTSEYYWGHNTWAPIMGASYNRPITQWSRGEYTGASNTTQDDLLVMAEYGAPRRADDHAATTAAATPVAWGVAAGGVITDATDRDWFSFDGGGPAQIMVTPNGVSPNLDVAVNLYNAEGGLVAQSDPASAWVHYDRASGMDSKITLDLPMGTYYVEVANAGAGDWTTGYTAYGSLGAYSVAIDTPSELSVAGGGMPPGAKKKLYSTTVSAVGGTGPYTWRVSGGALPAGLTMTSAGVISGTPTTLGTTTFEVEVTDAVGRRATATASILVAGPVTVATLSLPMASDDAPYSVTVASKGGGGTKRWTVSSGVMAPGLSVSRDGVISGTPITPGIYRATLQVTDGAGQIGRRTLTLNVAPLPPARVSRVATKRYDRWFQVNFIPVTSALRPHSVTHVLLDGVPYAETTGTSVVFNDMTPGQKYRVDLIAEGPGGRSAAYSAYPIAISVPVAASSPVATTGPAIGTGKALLTWTAAPTSAAAPRAGYRIYRDGVAIGTTTSTKYTARYLQPGQTYNFEIRTYGVAGEGGRVSVSAVPS